MSAVSSSARFAYGLPTTTSSRPDSTRSASLNAASITTKRDSPCALQYASSSVMSAGANASGTLRPR